MSASTSCICPITEIDRGSRPDLWLEVLPLAGWTPASSCSLSRATVWASKKRAVVKVKPLPSRTRLTCCALGTVQTLESAISFHGAPSVAPGTVSIAGAGQFPWQLPLRVHDSVHGAPSSRLQDSSHGTSSGRLQDSFRGTLSSTGQFSWHSFKYKTVSMAFFHAGYRTVSFATFSSTGQFPWHSFKYRTVSMALLQIQDRFYGTLSCRLRNTFHGTHLSRLQDGFHRTSSRKL